MADAIAYEIVKEIEDQLETISIANGYNTNVQQIFRRKKIPFEATITPALQVVPGRATKRQATTLHYDVRQNYNIMGFLNLYEESDADDQQIIQNFIADIERLAMQNCQWNDWAIDTEISFNDHEYIEQAESFVVIQVALVVQYRHSYTDPTSKGSGAIC